MLIFFIYLSVYVVILFSLTIVFTKMEKPALATPVLSFFKMEKPSFVVPVLSFKKKRRNRRWEYRQCHLSRTSLVKFFNLDVDLGFFIFMILVPYKTHNIKTSNRVPVSIVNLILGSSLIFYFLTNILRNDNMHLSLKFKVQIK